MNFFPALLSLFIVIKHNSAYLYWHQKPYLTRLNRLRIVPCSRPTQYPFYTKPVNYSNSSYI